MLAALVLLLGPLVTGGLVWLFFRRIQGPGAPVAGLRLITGNLLVLLFLASVVLAVGEAYYRYDHDTTDSLSYSKTSQRWFSRHWKSNAAGFRDNVEYADRIQPGKRRFTLLGDSFTAGHGVKDVEDRFANRIRRAHPEWEVHLLAQSGWDTGDELEALRTAVQRGDQLDQVVLVYMLNDVADILPAWATTHQRIMGDAAKRPWLQRHSYLVDAVVHLVKFVREPDMRNYFEFVRDGYRGPVWQHQMERLDSLREAVNAAGGHLVVVTFPFLHALGPKYEYRFIHEELSEFWGKRSVPQLDLLGIYQDIPPGKLVVNRLDAHPNEYAHGLAADAIGKFLERNLSAPGTPPPPPSSPSRTPGAGGSSR
jgi:hypothetical protein